MATAQAVTPEYRPDDWLGFFARYFDADTLDVGADCAVHMTLLKGRTWGGSYLLPYDIDSRDSGRTAAVAATIAERAARLEYDVYFQPQLVTEPSAFVTNEAGRIIDKPKMVTKYLYYGRQVDFSYFYVDVDCNLTSDQRKGFDARAATLQFARELSERGLLRLVTDTGNGYHLHFRCDPAGDPDFADVAQARLVIVQTLRMLGLTLDKNADNAMYSIARLPGTTNWQRLPKPDKYQTADGAPLPVTALMLGSYNNVVSPARIEYLYPRVNAQVQRAAQGKPAKPRIVAPRAVRAQTREDVAVTRASLLLGELLGALIKGGADAAVRLPQHMAGWSEAESDIYETELQRIFGASTTGEAIAEHDWLPFKAKYDRTDSMRDWWLAKQLALSRVRFNALDIASIVHRQRTAYYAEHGKTRHEDKLHRMDYFINQALKVLVLYDPYSLGSVARKLAEQAVCRVDGGAVVLSEQWWSHWQRLRRAVCRELEQAGWVLSRNGGYYHKPEPQPSLADIRDRHHRAQYKYIIYLFGTIGLFYRCLRGLRSSPCGNVTRHADGSVTMSAAAFQALLSEWSVKGRAQGYEAMTRLLLDKGGLLSEYWTHQSKSGERWVTIKVRRDIDVHAQLIRAQQAALSVINRERTLPVRRQMGGTAAGALGKREVMLGAVLLVLSTLLSGEVMPADVPADVAVARLGRQILHEARGSP